MSGTTVPVRDSSLADLIGPWVVLLLTHPAALQGSTYAVFAKNQCTLLSGCVKRQFPAICSHNASAASDFRSGTGHAGRIDSSRASALPVQMLCRESSAQEMRSRTWAWAFLERRAAAFDAASSLLRRAIRARASTAARPGLAGFAAASVAAAAVFALGALPRCRRVLGSGSRSCSSPLERGAGVIAAIPLCVDAAARGTVPPNHWTIGTGLGQRQQTLWCLQRLRAGCGLVHWIATVALTEH